MILEGAIGDAYGAGFEFANRSIVQAENDLTRYRPHPRYASIYKTYTDDTQMAIALAELLIEGADWTPEVIADKFVEVFKRDPRRGYSTRFYDLLTQVTSGTELRNTLKPGSTRNGAAMRAYPLGVLQDPKEIKEKAAIQAAVTHDSPEGILSAQAIALMAHYTGHRLGSLADLPAFLSDQQSHAWSSTMTDEVKVDGLQSVEAVLTMLVHHSESLSNLLVQSVNLCGDVDTVASLALAIASLDPSVTRDLPLWLSDELENGTYGRDYLLGLDERLLPE